MILAVLTKDMLLASENIVIIIFFIIIVVAVILAWWLGPQSEYQTGRFSTFIVILAGLGIFITILFYYNLVALQNQQQQLAETQELTRLNDSVLNSILTEMKDASTIVPNFVLSMTPLTNPTYCPTGVSGATGCMATVESDPMNPQTCTEKMVLSYRIFAMWQDTIMSNQYHEFSPSAYVSNFLQRANSPQLFEQWTANRVNYDPATQTFGDLLFEYGLPITNQVPQEYYDMAQKLIADPRFKQIVN
jgi:hypothetical protein